MGGHSHVQYTMGEPANEGDAIVKRAPSPGRMKVMVIIFIVLVAVANMGVTLFLPTIITNILSHKHPHWDKNDIIGKASTYKSFFDGFTAAIGFLTMPTIGALSDVYGRKKVMIITSFGYVIFMATIFASYMFSSLALLYIAPIFSFYAGAQVCAFAFMSDISGDHKDRAKNFGMVLASYIIGTIGAALMLGFLSEIGLVYICFILLGLSIAGVLFLLLFFVEHSTFYSKRHERKFNFSNANPVHCLRVLLTISPYVTVIVISNTLLNLAITNQVATGVLYTLHRYNWGAREYGISGAISAGASMLWQTAGVVVLQKRFSQENLLVSTLLLAAVIQFVQGVASVGWIFIIATIIGGYVSLAFPILQALASKRIPNEKQGIAFGGMSSLSSVGTMIGSLINENMFALCLKGDGYFTCPGTAFFFGAIMFAINAIMCITLFYKMKPEFELLEEESES